MRRFVTYVALGMFAFALVAPLAGCNKGTETTPPAGGGTTTTNTEEGGAAK